MAGYKRPSRKKRGGFSVGVGTYRVGTDYLSKHNVTNSSKDGRFVPLKGGGSMPSLPSMTAKQRLARGAGGIALGIGAIAALAAGAMVAEKPAVKAAAAAALRAKSKVTGKGVRKLVTKRESGTIFRAVRSRWGFR